MSNSNNIISKPVSLPNDVAVVVGTSNDLASACVSGNINIYSRHKPMRINTVGEATKAMKKAANYGYVFPVDLPVTQLMLLALYGVMPSDWTSKVGDSNYRELTNEWYYAKPRGLNYNEWYRLLDFDGYKHTVPTSLLETNIPTSFTLGQSGSFYASIFQQEYANMANFWEDASHTAPMSLGGYTYHAFGVAVASSGLTQARLEASTASAHCGQWCKYYVWASPVSGANFEKTLADDLFVSGAGTYRIVPFIIGSNSTIPAQSNIGSEVFGLNGCIPLPCAFTYCNAGSSPTPTEQFSIYGTPTYAQSGGRVNFTFQISYTSGLQGTSVDYVINDTYNGSTSQLTYGSVTLNTASGTYPRRKSTTKAVAMSISSGHTYTLVVSRTGYPSATKTFREEIDPTD